VDSSTEGLTSRAVSQGKINPPRILTALQTLRASYRSTCRVPEEYFYSQRSDAFKPIIYGENGRNRIIAQVSWEEMEVFYRVY
jgi:hypothetical protein